MLSGMRHKICSRGNPVLPKDKEQTQSGVEIDLNTLRQGIQQLNSVVFKTNFNIADAEQGLKITSNPMNVDGERARMGDAIQLADQLLLIGKSSQASKELVMETVFGPDSITRRGSEWIDVI